MVHNMERRSGRGDWTQLEFFIVKAGKISSKTIDIISVYYLRTASRSCSTSRRGGSPKSLL